MKAIHSIEDSILTNSLQNSLRNFLKEVTNHCDERANGMFVIFRIFDDRRRLGRTYTRSHRHFSQRLPTKID